MTVMDVWCYIAGIDKQRHCFRIRARPTDTVYDLKKRIVQERPIKAITEAAQLQLYKCPFPNSMGQYKSSKKQQNNSTSNTSMNWHATSGTSSVDSDSHNSSSHTSASNATPNQSEDRYRLLSNQQLISGVLPELFQLEFISMQQKWIPLRVSIHDKYAPLATFKLYSHKVGIAISIQQDSMDDLRKLLRSSLVASESMDVEQIPQKTTSSSEEETMASIDQSNHVYILNQQHGQITSLNQLRESRVYDVVIGKDEWHKYIESISAEEKRTNAELAKQSAELERLTNIAEKLIEQLITAANAIKQQSKISNKQSSDMSHRDTTEKNDTKTTSHDSTIVIPREIANLNRSHSNPSACVSNSSNSRITKNRTTSEQVDPLMPMNSTQSTSCPVNSTTFISDSLKEMNTNIDDVSEVSDRQHGLLKRRRVERICSTPPSRIQSSTINQILARQEVEELRQAAASVVEPSHHTKQAKKPRQEPVRELKNRYPPVNLNDVFGHNRNKDTRQSGMATSSKRRDTEKTIDVDQQQQHTVRESRHQQASVRSFTSHVLLSTGNILFSASTIGKQTNTNNNKIISKRNMVNENQTSSIIDNSNSNENNDNDNGDDDDDGNLSDITDIPTPPGLREVLELRDARMEQARKKGLIPISDLKFPVNAPGYKEPEVKSRQTKLSSMYFSKSSN